MGADFERVKKTFRAGEVSTVLDIAKREERAAEEQRRAAKRKHNRDCPVIAKRALAALLAITMRRSGRQPRAAKPFIYPWLSGGTLLFGVYMWITGRYNIGER